MGGFIIEGFSPMPPSMAPKYRGTGYPFGRRVESPAAAAAGITATTIGARRMKCAFVFRQWESDPPRRVSFNQGSGLACRATTRLSRSRHLAVTAAIPSWRERRCEIARQVSW